MESVLRIVSNASLVFCTRKISLVYFLDQNYLRMGGSFIPASLGTLILIIIDFKGYMVSKR